MVHAMTKVYMKQIEYIIYCILVDLMTFDLGWALIKDKIKNNSFFCVGCIFWMVHVMTKIYMIFDLGWPLKLDDLCRSNQCIECLVGCISWLVYVIIWICVNNGQMYDFMGTMEVILSDIWKDFNLTQFHFWSTFHMNWHKWWPHMTFYWLSKRFWAMFEPTSTWPNFAFGQRLTWIGTNNDHICECHVKWHRLWPHMSS